MVCKGPILLGQDACTKGQSEVKVHVKLITNPQMGTLCTYTQGNMYVQRTNPNNIIIKTYAGTSCITNWMKKYRKKVLWKLWWIYKYYRPTFSKFKKLTIVIISLNADLYYAWIHNLIIQLVYADKSYI